MEDVFARSAPTAAVTGNQEIIDLIQNLNAQYQRVEKELKRSRKKNQKSQKKFRKIKKELKWRDKAKQKQQNVWWSDVIKKSLPQCFNLADKYIDKKYPPGRN